MNHMALNFKSRHLISHDLRMPFGSQHMVSNKYMFNEITQQKSKSIVKVTDKINLNPVMPG